MESRSRASPEQFAAILEFMESHGDIIRPQQGPQGRLKADRLWQELGEILNSIGGGVRKPVDKWKKVWADWKTKTKKKALAIRHEASGTGGGPSSRQTLTASEERVLGIMGMTAVTGLAGIEERGFNTTPSTSTTRETVGIVHATDDVILDFILPDSIQASTSSALPLPPQLSGDVPRYPPPPVLTPPPGTAPASMPSATSPTTSMPPRRAPQRRRHQATPSPTGSTPQRRGLLRGRTRRIQTPFERATSEFVDVEHRRLQLEADREKNLHEREMERLRLESRRIEMVDNQNLILNRLAGAIDNLTEIINSTSSLPSTVILP